MAFDLQPLLQGELLRLRPLRADDFPALYVVASDPLIWEQHPSKDRYQEAVFKEFFREALASGGTLIAIDAKDGQVIGSSRFHGYDPEHSEVEIGWTFKGCYASSTPLRNKGGCASALAPHCYGLCSPDPCVGQGTVFTAMKVKQELTLAA